MNTKIKVEGYTNLVRDIKTKAIVNTSTTEYNMYMSRIKAREKQGDEIRTAVKELNSLKQDIFEIKNMLKDLGKK